MKLAATAGLQNLADQWLTAPTDKGANAGLKVDSLVGGMAAGADSIDDMAILRHGGMPKIFTACYAPSTLGSFLRPFTFGHIRQLDAVASRFVRSLAAEAPAPDEMKNWRSCAPDKPGRHRGARHGNHDGHDGQSNQAPERRQGPHGRKKTPSKCGDIR